MLPPHVDGPHPTGGSSLESHNTGSGPVTSGTASGIGLSGGDDDWPDTIATVPFSCDAGAYGQSDVGSPNNLGAIGSSNGSVRESRRCRSHLPSPCGSSVF